MDIGGWLRNLGLGQYERAFRDNEIDDEVLPNLTGEDLKDIGVEIVGHRRKILTAITELRAAQSPEPARNVQDPQDPQDAAERRQLTVMFCDLVGSTALSASLDPEDMRQVIRVYQDACSGVVARYDGFVAKFMGDGILAYFGFPRAHEDDSARAVHAGLEIAEVVAGLRSPAREQLAVRVGIATGLVVVGDLVGRGSAQEQAVVGDTPNLAARLQGLAEAGGVVIAGTTRRLLGDRFRLRNLGKHAVKGLAERVEAWAALGVSQSESRFEAAHAARLTGFVGREPESAELLERQRRAWSGAGQIALISGEAGIGKSRLSAWLAEQVADTPHTRLRYQCSPYHRDSALYPFVQQLERAAGVAPQEPPESKLQKLERVLALSTDRVIEVAPLFAAMLSIPPGGRYPPLNLSPAQQRRQTLSALLDQMEGLARKQPVLMMFEDVHWADATTLEVIDLSIERVRRLPVLLLITYRPEFEPPWKGLPDVATATLQRLDRVQAETLIEQVTGGRKLPAEVMAQIVAKTDGVPLFVEELTKNVLESGLLVEETERFRLDGPLPPLAIPSTLQDSLMARLDRLAAVKEIAQIGAVIGREFSYLMLQAVAGRDEAALRASLMQLEDAELVFRSGEPPAARYMFKHALVQDTAYESLLKSRRQILHQRIAEALRDKFPDVVEAEPELIAEHYTRAGLIEPAVVHWGKAGDLALRRSAFKEAIAHLGKAIEMSEAAAEEKGKTSERLKLQVSYGGALAASRGQGAPEARTAFERARELASRGDEAAHQFSANYGLWNASYARGELDLMRRLSEACLRDTENQPESGEASVAHRLAGVTNWWAGEFVEARAHLLRALSIFDPDRDSGLANRLGLDSGVATLGYAAPVLWIVGEVDQAAKLENEMSERAANIEHTASSALSGVFGALNEFARRRPPKAEEYIKRIVEFANEHEMALWIEVSALMDAWVRFQTDRWVDSLQVMRQQMALLRERGFIAAMPMLETMLAEVETGSGAVSAALTTLDEAIANSAKVEQRHFDAELHRTRGEILLAQNPTDPSPAEAAFLAAIAVAQQQKARSFELRAALSLAKLYHSAGRPSDAYDVLGPALQGFPPTPEFPEIAEAKALFEALAADEMVKTEATRRAQRLKLQTRYGQAVMWTKGFSAEETKAAVARTRELATELGDSETSLDAYYGRWVHSLYRGELGAAQDTAERFLGEAESESRPMEAGVAHRVLGLTLFLRGDFAGAQANFERTLQIYDPERDGDAKFRFGLDTKAAATAFLATAAWCSGYFDRAGELIDAAAATAIGCAHNPTLAITNNSRVAHEILRGDAEAVRRAAGAVIALSREHGLPLYLGYGALAQAWSRAKLGDPDAGSAEFRLALAEYVRQGNKVYLPAFRGMLAEMEAERGNAEAALSEVDAALALADETGEHWYDATLHRTRGEILLRQNPADPAAAEAAFRTAIVVAQSQKARAFELRAALALARLCQSTDRLVEAHDVLGHALEGFSPTPEFPEIAEAQNLLIALADDARVKAAIAARERRLKLQTQYGQAMMWHRGFAADETRAAFTRARELAAGVNSPTERFVNYYGQWVGRLLRAELADSAEIAEAFLREATAEGGMTETAVSSRLLGLTRFTQGRLEEAEANFEEALKLNNPERDRDAQVRFAIATGAVTTVTLGLVKRQLGKIEAGRALIEKCIAEAIASGHPPTLVCAYYFKAQFEVLSDDCEAAEASAQSVIEISDQHGLGAFRPGALLYREWSRARLAGRRASPEHFQKAIAARAAISDVEFRLWLPFYEGLLARLEAEQGETDAALARIDAALALAAETGEHWTDSLLLRLRGEFLLERDPKNKGPAEEAFLAAIALAREQKARVFELQAALSLANLYESSNRLVDAHDVLGPALQGFSPTPELPAIARAQALLAAARAGARL